MPDEGLTFFEKERDRLATEISSSFEHLLSSTNLLNRKLEEVLGMTKEYETISALWTRFNALMRVYGGADALAPETNPPVSVDESLTIALHDRDALANAPTGLPGTGGYTLQTSRPDNGA